MMVVVEVVNVPMFGWFDYLGWGVKRMLFNDWVLFGFFGRLMGIIRMTKKQSRILNEQGESRNSQGWL